MNGRVGSLPTSLRKADAGLIPDHPLPAQLRQELIGWAAMSQTEVCGYVVATGAGVPVSVVPVQNVAKNSDHSFRMWPQQQLRVLNAVEELGMVVYGMYHSHPQGPAALSRVDDLYLPIHNLLQILVCPWQQSGQVLGFYYLDDVAVPVIL